MPAAANISLTPRAGDQPLYRIERGGHEIPTSELPMQYAIAHRTHVTNDIEIGHRNAGCDRAERLERHRIGIEWDIGQQSGLEIEPPIADPCAACRDPGPFVR